MKNIKDFKQFEGFWSRSTKEEPVISQGRNQTEEVKKQPRTKEERLKTAEDILVAFEENYNDNCNPKSWDFYQDVYYNTFLKMESDNLFYITSEQFKKALSLISDYKDDWMNSDKEREMIKSKLLTSFVWDIPPRWNN